MKRDVNGVSSERDHNIAALYSSVNPGIKPISVCR
jgi:hypothetical protein